jgi:hypothetical protein
MKREEAHPPARVTIHVIRPDMERIVIVEPIPDRGVRQARTVEALRSASNKALVQLGGVPEGQLRICR